ncbi:MAG: hypothetical protein HW399_1024 [Dehalococcoidia bacterium]|nr:hypothetical protein [Dehalococcoidia bacterium]
MTTEAELKIKPQDIAKLAEMAGLRVEAARLDALTARYSGFLNELEKLRELDINDQEPAFFFRAGESLL